MIACHTHQVALINLCWGTALLADIPWASPTTLGIFSALGVAQTVSIDRSVTYLPTPTLAWIAYGMAMLRSPIRARECLPACMYSHGTATVP